MRSTIFPFGTVLALAAPLAPAAGAASDFRLPPSPAETPADRQGPVAPDVPESRRPAPTPTPAPTGEAPPIEVPAASALPVVVPPQETGEPAMPPAQRAQGRREAGAAGNRAEPSPAPASDVAQEGSALEFPPVAASPATSAPAPQAGPAAAAEDGTPLGPWLAGGVAALAAAGLLAWLWRRPRRGVGAAAVPRIERPRPAADPPPPGVGEVPAPAATEPAPAEPLEVTLEPLRMSLTLLNATLAYRLEIANRGAAPLTALSIGADMISAHASISREEQLSGPGAQAQPLQRIERLEPGESRIVAGEFRVPFTQIRPIRQGSAALLLPLARFRVEAEGARPVIRTFAVGEAGAGAGLQPFRLDLGPRVYPRLAQRAFA